VKLITDINQEKSKKRASAIYEKVNETATQRRENEIEDILECQQQNLNDSKRHGHGFV
jgi:hypothetical protein